MEEFLEKLSDIKEGVDFAKEEKLIDGHILASLDIIAIVGMISDEYDVTVPVSKLTPAYFNSAAAMWNLIQELSDE